MREQLASEGELVAAIGEHVLSSGGKRVRPALLLLCAELCGYTGPRRVQVAAAVELLHSATLLHDDVVDLSQLRRATANDPCRGEIHYTHWPNGVRQGSSLHDHRSCDRSAHALMVDGTARTHLYRFLPVVSKSGRYAA